MDDDNGRDLETPPKRAKLEGKAPPGQRGPPPPGNPAHQYGMQASFDLDEYKKAMKTHGTYRCGANEWWLDFWFTSQPGVPYNKSSIYQLAENSFKEPNQWTGTNIVLVTDLNFNPLEHQGSLRRLSPEEINFARVIGISMAIDAGASEETLRAFKTDLQCASFQFEFHEGGLDNPSHSGVKRAINLRESMRQVAKAVGRDCLQRIYEVLRIRKLMEQSAGNKQVSTQALVDYYEKEIRLSTDSEAVSKTFIEQTSVVYNTILKVTKNLQILRHMAEMWGNNAPLNSINKLEMLLRKCDKNGPMITWCLEKVRDICLSGAVDPGEISYRALKEGNGGHKGLVDLWVLKKQVMNHLLSADIDQRLRGHGSSKKRDSIVGLLNSHDNYRAKLCPIGKEVDLTFLAEYKDSEKMTIRLYEALVYGSEFDAQLRYCARSKKTPDEVLQTDCIKAEVDKIDAQIALEAAVDDVAKSGVTGTSSQPPPPPAAPGAATASTGAAATTVPQGINDDKVAAATTTATTTRDDDIALRLRCGGRLLAGGSPRARSWSSTVAIARLYYSLAFFSSPSSLQYHSPSSSVSSRLPHPQPRSCTIPLLLLPARSSFSFPSSFSSFPPPACYFPVSFLHPAPPSPIAPLLAFSRAQPQPRPQPQPQPQQPLLVPCPPPSSSICFVSLPGSAAGSAVVDRDR